MNEELRQQTTAKSSTTKGEWFPGIAKEAVIIKKVAARHESRWALPGEGGGGGRWRHPPLEGGSC